MRTGRSLALSALVVATLGGCNQIFGIEDPNRITTDDGGDGGADARMLDAPRGTDSSAVSPIGLPPYALTRAGTTLGPLNLTATSATIASGTLTAWMANASPNGESPALGSNSVADFGVDSDFSLIWGRWAGGTTDCCMAVSPTERTFPLSGGLHYVLGRSSPAHTGPPGPFNYKLIASTQATTADGAVAPGKVTGSAALLFTTVPSIGLALEIESDVRYTVATPGGTASPLDSPVSFRTPNSILTQTNLGAFVVPEVGRACNGGQCLPAISGFMAGGDMERMALVVQIYQGAPGDAHNVTVVAIFAKQ
jgi:hypothetical protein